MLVIRPVTPNDLDALLDLATFTGFGLTTLPKDREFLSKRINKSLRSFRDMGDQPSGECYLFVLEDQANQKIVGTCGVVSKVGGFEPFYVYRLETAIHESACLGVRKEIQLLHLVSEHNGPCEIGSLFLSPDYRKDGNGRLLSLSRFLFMAEWPQSFDPMVIAEMRGVIDEEGRSAFWDAIGRHFFEIEFPKADYLSLTNKRFIADLMPKHPIYTVLLPPEAQAVIGQVHQQTKPALRVLIDEGFRFNGMVDIFEAGPVVTCALPDIRSIRESRLVQVAEVTDLGATGGLSASAHREYSTGSKLPVAPIEQDAGFETGSNPCIISNARQDFRACRNPLKLNPAGAAILGRECAAALQVGVGDWVRFISLPPAGKERTV